MYVKAAITGDDLVRMMRILYADNGKGEVVAVSFRDINGAEIEFGYMEVISEEQGIVVGKPPPSPYEEAVASMYRPLTVLQPGGASG